MVYDGFPVVGRVQDVTEVNEGTPVKSSDWLKPKRGEKKLRTNTSEKNKKAEKGGRAVVFDMIQ